MIVLWRYLRGDRNGVLWLEGGRAVQCGSSRSTEAQVKDCLLLCVFICSTNKEHCGKVYFMLVLRNVRIRTLSALRIATLSSSC